MVCGVQLDCIQGLQNEMGEEQENGVANGGGMNIKNENHVMIIGLPVVHPGNDPEFGNMNCWAQPYHKRPVCIVRHITKTHLEGYKYRITHIVKEIGLLLF